MKTKFKFFLFLFLISTTFVEANQTIYILLTHPRATGTAFEKVMRTQKDLVVFHAPYLDPYLIKKYGTYHPFTRDLPNPNLTFEDVTNHLFKIAETSPVFFKESGYLLIDYIKSNPNFYKHPQIKFAFLVRDPAKSILSYYRKMPTVNESIIGHQQLWELFTFLKEVKGETPLVIDSDEFLKDPLHILNALGKEWNLKFNNENLKWEQGYEEDWHLKDWYVEVANSTELEAYRGDVPRETDGTPKYLEVTNAEDRLRLQTFFKSQNPYYQNLLRFAIKSICYDVDS